MTDYTPWTMAYWYAVGRNDERAGSPRAGIPDYVDPLEFANHYERLHTAYRAGETASLACIPDIFTEWLEDAHARQL